MDIGCFVVKFLLNKGWFYDMSYNGWIIVFKRIFYYNVVVSRFLGVLL